MPKKGDFQRDATLNSFTRHCVVCTKPIPDKARRDVVTCSKECVKIRRKVMIAMLDAVRCKYCQRPSTPEERARYRRWRLAEAAEEKRLAAEAVGD